MSDWTGLGTVIGAGLNFFGQQATNASNAQQAAQQMAFQQQQQIGSQEFNANQADLARQYGYQTQYNAEAFNDSQAQKQMQFQEDVLRNQQQYNTASVAEAQAFGERMSSTAYQRSVADMKAAGLNPILGVASGGAGTPSVAPIGSAAPSGAAGSVSGSSSPAASVGMQSGARAEMTSPLMGLVAGARQGQEVGKTLDMLSSQIANLDADTSNKIAANPNINADTRSKLSSASLNAAKEISERHLQDNMDSSSFELLSRVGLNQGNLLAALAQAQKSEQDTSSAKTVQEYQKMLNRDYGSSGPNSNTYSGILKSLVHILGGQGLGSIGGDAQPRAPFPGQGKSTYTPPATD